MPLSNNPLKFVLAIAVFATAMTAFAVGDVVLLDQYLGSILMWFFPLVLAMSYLLSQVTLGQLEGWKLGMFGVVLLSFFGQEYVGPINDIIGSMQPHSGIALTVMSLVVFYFFTQESL